MSLLAVSFGDSPQTPSLCYPGHPYREPHSVEGGDGYSVPDLFFQTEGESGEDRLANLDEFDRRWYELRIETLSGRQSE